MRSLAYLLALMCGLIAQAQQMDSPRTIAHGAVQSHPVELAAGGYVNIAAAQQGAKVTLTLKSPSGEALVTRNVFPPPQTEELSTIVTAAGTYTLEVKAAGAGSYRLAIRTVAAAGEKERLCVDAEALFQEGARTRAIPKLEQALAKWRSAEERRWEGRALYQIGRVHGFEGRLDQSLPLLDQSVALLRTHGDLPDLSAALFHAGWTRVDLGYYVQSRPYLEEAIRLRRQLGDRVGEQRALGQLGASYSYTFQNTRAREIFEQSLAIIRELKMRRAEGPAIEAVAGTYAGSNYGVMLDMLQQALAIHRELKDRLHEGQTLANIATAYIDLSQYDKALAHAELAYQISKEIRNRRLEGFAGGTVGVAQYHLGRYEQALSSLDASFSVFRSMKSKYGEANVLNYLGLTYAALGRYADARRACEQAMAIAREARIGLAEGESLQYLGEFALHEKDKAARTHFEQALAHRRRIRDRAGEGVTLSSLMAFWKEANRPRQAIFFGKQAVNAFQDIRAGIQTAQQETQKAFLQAKESTYRQLADLLIAGGRLPEAEQVIRMLKEEEFFDYVRRDSETAPQGERAAWSAEEAAAEKRYREIADQLSDIGAQRGALLEKPSRSAEEDKLLAKLEGDLTVAGQMFQKFLDGLENELGAEAKPRVFQLRESQGMMEALDKDTIALYTLVGADKYRVIVTTANAQKGYEYAIKAEDLNRKILAFREALQNPKLDPVPLAQELYRILVAPMSKDLARAQTLMWSLDGVLRYIPVGALHDGQKYIAERWRHVVFTPASQTRLKDPVSKNWSVLGLGVTKSHGEKIPALPGVAEEMSGIVQPTGVLPGAVKLDEEFTRDSMLAGLRSRPPVVHVASHFQFQPGNEADSALLLGDGNLLSLTQIKALPNVFSGVELLTLSACNTATSGSGATGKEVEGFAVLAQRQGAKAVVASLWPVADRSTKDLMQEFYRLREAKGMSKAEALRQAQLKLLRGEMGMGGGASASRQLTHERSFDRDPNKPFAHPYYWAPFILIGNSR